MLVLIVAKSMDSVTKGVCSASRAGVAQAEIRSSKGGSGVAGRVWGIAELSLSDLVMSCQPLCEVLAQPSQQ